MARVKNDPESLEICRVCEKIDDELIYIYAEISVSEKLTMCANISVQENDQLPQYLCSECSNDLETAYRFKNLCEATDRKLREKVLQTKTEYLDTGTQIFLEVEKLEEEQLYDDRNENTEDENDEDSNEEDSNETAEIHHVAKSGRKRAPRRSEFNCETCLEKFKNYNEYNAHIKGHGNERFQCKVCQKWFLYKHKLQKHEFLHLGLRNYECEICNKKYATQKNLQRHIKDVHEQEKKHVCDVCNKAFSQKTVLQQHYYVHVDERNFDCDECPKKFKTAHLLKQHKESHLPIEQRTLKVYRYPKKRNQKRISICPYCGKKSNTLSIHNDHIRTHTGEKPFECSSCHKQFSTFSSCRNHSLIHSGARPYACDLCKMTFRQLNHLKIHKLTHSGLKPHVCLICGKTFSIRGNLNAHTRLHTGELPFKCEFCEKKFNDSSALKRHSQQHGSGIE